MKVSAIIRKDQPDSEGLCKIYIRIYDKQKRKYVPTEFKVLASQFQKGKVTRHPDADNINLQLQALFIHYKSHQIPNRATIKPFSEKFFEEATEHELLKPPTIKAYKTKLRTFIEFAGDIELKKINEQLLKEYNAFLIKRGNDHNTRVKSFDFLRKILHVAKIYPNPVSQWKERPNRRENPKTWLTQSEVKRIKKEVDKMPDDNPLKKIGLWCLLQCHIGVAVSDLRKLNSKNFIEGKRLVTNRKKTGELTTVPLTPEIKSLLKAVGPLTISDQDYNRGLKLIASLAKIEKNLSSHVLRHTFGVRLAELGVSTEVIAKLMGHKKLATTAIYTQIQDKRVDSEFKGFGY